MISPTAATPLLPVAVHAYGLTTKPDNNGFVAASVSLYFVNTQPRAIAPLQIAVSDAHIETAEGVTYPASTDTILVGYNVHPEGGYFDYDGDAIIPPGIPFVQLSTNEGTGDFNTVGWSYAPAAHPTSLVIDSDRGRIVVDLASIPSSLPPETLPSDLQPAPIQSFLQRAETDNDKYAITFDGTCSQTGEDFLTFSLNFHVTSKDKFNSDPINSPINQYVVYDSRYMLNAYFWNYTVPGDATHSAPDMVGPLQTVAGTMPLGDTYLSDKHVPRYLYLPDENRFYQLDCASGSASSSGSVQSVGNGAQVSQGGALASGISAVVRIPGDCLNAHTDVGLAQPVVACIPDGSVLRVAGGPRSADGKTWWQLENLGWVVQDYLAASAGGGPSGSQVASITTDEQGYHIGDKAQACYTVPNPGPVKFTDLPPDGTKQVLFAFTDDGTGGCEALVITPPSGNECIQLDYSRDGNPGWVKTCFNVTQ